MERNVNIVKEASGYRAVVRMGYHDSEFVDNNLEVLVGRVTLYLLSTGDSIGELVVDGVKVCD